MPMYAIESCFGSRCLKKKSDDFYIFEFYRFLKVQVLNSKKYVHIYLAQTPPRFVVRYGFLNVDRYTFIMKFC